MARILFLLLHVSVMGSAERRQGTFSAIADKHTHTERALVNFCGVPDEGQKQNWSCAAVGLTVSHTKRGGS